MLCSWWDSVLGISHSSHLCSGCKLILWTQNGCDIFLAFVDWHPSLGHLDIMKPSLLHVWWVLGLIWPGRTMSRFPCTLHMFSGAGGLSVAGVNVCVCFFFLIKLVETPGEFFSEPTTSKQTLNAWLAVDTRTCFSSAAWKLCRLRPARMAAVCLTSQFMALLLGNNEEEGTISQPQRMPLKIRGLSEVSRHLRMFFSACTLLPLSSELTCRS